ncbi:MAG: hypothetical protein JWO34_2743 [Arthrobacter sp.]|nr:hypothetical protein [Arthrobacter sp.]
MLAFPVPVEVVSVVVGLQNYYLRRILNSAIEVVADIPRFLSRGICDAGVHGHQRGFSIRILHHNESRGRREALGRPLSWQRRRVGYIASTVSKP